MKIRHWFVKTVVKNLYLVLMSSSFLMKRDLKICQRGASLADKRRRCQEVHPVVEDLDNRDSSTPSPVRIAATRPKCLSSHPEIGPFIVGTVIRSIDSW